MMHTNSRNIAPTLPDNDGVALCARALEPACLGRRDTTVRNSGMPPLRVLQQGGKGAEGGGKYDWGPFALPSLGVQRWLAA